MATINQRINRYRQELADRETAATAEMIRAYTRSWEAIYAELRELSLRVAVAEEAGQFSPAWIYQENRLRSFAQTVASEIAGLTGVAKGQLSGLTVDFIAKAEAHTQELIRAQMGTVPAGAVPSFTRLNPGVVESIVAASGPGSPVAALFDEMPAGTAARVSTILTNGVAIGRGMEEIAREIKPEIAGDATRSVAIARTESLRAYRSAAIANYSQNADVVKGWQWSAQLSRRTCPVCIAMHGSIHPLTEPFGSHVNCRCVPIPYTASWQELGFDDIEETAPKIESGSDWFYQQAEDTQNAILGPKKAELYRSGAIELVDVIGFRQSATWGEIRWERSIKDIQEFGRQTDAINPYGLVDKREAFKPTPKPEPTPDLTAAGKKPRKPRAKKEAPAEEEAGPELTAAEARAAVLAADAEVRRTFRDDFSGNFFKRRDEAIRQKTQEAVYQKTAATIKVRYSGIPVADRAKYADGLEGFARLIGKSAGVDGKEVTVKKTAKPRSHYDNKGAVCMYSLAKNRVLVHELGHWLEDVSPDIHAEVLDFFARRTKGFPLEKMSKLTGNSAYRAHEVSYKDNFIDAYMGKWYFHGGRQYATEILSMGLELMYADPARLAANDPDFFDFIYDLVRRKR